MQHFTEVCFAGVFTIVALINPSESKLAKGISVHCTPVIEFLSQLPMVRISESWKCISKICFNVNDDNCRVLLFFKWLLNVFWGKNCLLKFYGNRFVT